MITLNIAELGQQLQAKQMEYKAKFDAYPMKKLPDGSEAKDIPANDIEGLRTLMSEINDLGKKFEDAKELVNFNDRNLKEIQEKHGLPTNRPEMKNEAKAEEKGFYDRMFAEVKNAGGLKNGMDIGLDWDPRLEMKTTMTTSAGYTPFSARSDVRIDTVQILPTLLDYLPVIPIGQNSYKFMKETTFTNSATVKAEATAYDEAALALTESTVSMTRLGVYLPVSEDQLEDEPSARAYLEARLGRMVRIKAEYQALNGNGTPPQWNGILGLSGIQSVAATSFGSKFDAIFRAILNVGRFDSTSYGGAMPNLVVLNPSDWEDLVTMRTSDGVYILQNPGQAPLSRCWGLPVAQNYTITSGTGLVLDTSFFPMGMRRDLRVAISDSHGELFIAGVLAVRVDIKGNIIAHRDAAACKITGL